MAKDVNFGSVVLLMHMDGVDNGTAFADQRGKVVSVFGHTATKTAQKKFGTASAYFDGSGDYLTVPASSSFDFSSSDFTVEFWMYPTALGTTQFLCGARSTSTGDGWEVFAGDSSEIIVQGTPGGITSPASTLTANTWQHIAICKSGANVVVFHNGVQKATGTPVFPSNTSVEFRIGTRMGPSPYSYSGYIDDLRITKGVARYTADFTPPTEAFPDGGYEVGGTVLDINGNPVARTFRAYHRDTGALLGTGVSSAVTGAYNIAVDHSGEVQVVMLDDAGGSTENDQILRTTPV